MDENSARGSCPVCRARLVLSADLVEGEILECDDCGVDLEVLGLGPIELRECSTEDGWEEESDHEDEGDGEEWER